MNIPEMLRERAKKEIRKIVLPEGEEPRMIKAAEIVYREGFAELVFLGKEEKIKSTATVRGSFPRISRLLTLNLLRH